MNRQALAIPAAILALVLAACADSNGSARPAPLSTDLASGISLPRIGTVGIMPDAARRLVVNVDADGTFVVEGRTIPPTDLGGFLKSHADLSREPLAPHASRLFLVLRLDRTLPWEIARRIRVRCDAPGVLVDRVHFAVLPEDGDEEGSLAAHLCLTDRIARDEDAIEPARLVAEVRLEADGRDAGGMFSRAREILTADPDMPCEVRPDPLAPVGEVLRAADVLHRAGARAVTFSDSQRLAGKTVAEVIALSREDQQNCAVYLVDQETRPAPAPMPPVARVRGAFAGTIRSRHAPREMLLPVHDRPPEIQEIRIRSSWFEALRVPEEPGRGEELNPPTRHPDPDWIAWPVLHDIAGGAGERYAIARIGTVPFREGGLLEEAGPQPGSLGLALDWLRNHQDPAGHWDADEFEDRCRLNRCGGPGYSIHDTGVTGLALLAFLGAGETHRSGHHRASVRAGLAALKRGQDEEGCYPSRTSARFTYDHAVATLAMTEACGATGSPLFRTSAQSAVDFIEKCRNPYLAWRHGVRPQDNDTSVTAWMVLALHSAKQAGGLRVPREAFEGAKNWLDKVTEPEYGKVGFTARGTGPARPQDLMDRFPADRSEALTAMGVVCRTMLGEDPATSEMIRKGEELCLKVLPDWNEPEGTIDMIYWYFGTRAMRAVGGESWAAWRAALDPTIRNHQRRDGDQMGSWDPKGVWGRYGGRIYSTAIMAMTLEAMSANRVFSRR